MKDIEKLLQRSCIEDIKIPETVDNKIEYTLKHLSNKNNKINYIKRIITAFISTIIALVGSVTVYAAFGGTIEGIPATDWLGIKFSSKYVEYKQPVEDQVIAFENTSIELSSTLCNEGITILEFDLKLSKEDYKKLKLDESIITDEYLQNQDEYKSKLRDNIILNLRTEKYNRERQNGNYNIKTEDIIISEEEINAKYEEKLADIEKNIEERKNTFFKPALALNVEQKGGTWNYDIFNPNMDWYASIYIDDIPYLVKNMQKVKKINDYEYKIYTMYAITEDILNGKENFKITLKNNKLVNKVEWNSLSDSWNFHCQWFARDDSSRMLTPAITIIDLPSEFEVNVSKNDVLNDSIIIENQDIKSEFRNITHTVEKAVISPIQTIVRINHSATNQSSTARANKRSNSDIEQLPLTREYKAYDANGKELSCFSISNKNTLIYSDGTREDYDSHDFPNKKYSNATWENIHYLLIESTDTEYIKIVPVECIYKPIDGNDSYGEKVYEMEPLIINIK